MIISEIAHLLNRYHLLHSVSPRDLPSIGVASISTDSRLIEPGALFIAIKGIHHDGHSFASQAVANGAIAVISEYPLDIPVPVLHVVNSRKASAILSSQFWGDPGKDLLCIGVTGTNGKTTTAFMVDAILEEMGYKTGLIGTVLTKMNNRVLQSTMTTPDAPALHHILHHMVEKSVEAVAMEISSHGILQDRCYGLDLHSGILTNISYDHLDIHPSFEHYIETKKAFFQLVAEDGLSIANGDDPVIQEAMPERDWPNLVRFGVSRHCLVRAEKLAVSGKGSAFTLVWDQLPALGGGAIPPGNIAVSLHVPGLHNIYNALGAAAAGLFFRAQPEVISNALHGFTGVSRRLQVLHSGDFLVLDDFAHNPASIKTSIEAVRGLVQRNLIIVNALRGNRGVGINQENAKILGECYRHATQPTKIILTSSIDAVGAHDEVSSEEKQAFLRVLQNAQIPYSFFPNLRGALKSALNLVRDGDLILLLGAQGMDHAGQIFTELISAIPEVNKADPFDELSGEPAIVGIKELAKGT